MSVQRESHSVVWVKLNGKYLSLPSDISIGFVYIPPEGSTHAVGDTDIFDDLSASIQTRSKQGQVVICEDLNSRTGKLLDFIYETYPGDIPPCTAFATSEYRAEMLIAKLITMA